MTCRAETLTNAGPSGGCVVRQRRRDDGSTRRSAASSSVVYQQRSGGNASIGRLLVRAFTEPLWRAADAVDRAGTRVRAVVSQCGSSVDTVNGPVGLWPTASWLAEVIDLEGAAMP